MAIYHLEAKVVTRGIGRTACGAAAYMSCSRLYNDYDGIQHDYTHKGGLVWEHVFLPPIAPSEWQDREKLWNAVEAAEKTKDSRLAREFIVALPRELDKAAWKAILTEYIQDSFVSGGMCADVSVHDTDGHNPHAHILLTVRPLNDNGTWQHKTEKEYLCVRDGEERGFTAAEFKTAQAKGWEKQYQYKVGKKKSYMTPSEAEARGLERASKHPKATRYGRQNPISERWNSEAQLVAWRAAWADVVNRALERSGVEARVDHRSHAERGLDEKPTIHEGVSARILEKMGGVSDRCEINRQIYADNALIRELKATIKKLIEAITLTLAEIARVLEQLRQSLIILHYHLRHVRKRRSEAKDYLSKAEPAYKRYDDLGAKITKKEKQRDQLESQVKALPMLSVFKRNELKAKIAVLTEDIGELEFERDQLVRDFGKENAKDMSAVKTDIETIRKNVGKMDELETRYTNDITESKQKFNQLKKQSTDFDLLELTEARLALRPSMEDAAQECIRKEAPDGKVSIRGFWMSVSETDKQLREDGMAAWHKEQQRLRQIEQNRGEQHPKRKTWSHEQKR